MPKLFRLAVSRMAMRVRSPSGERKPALNSERSPAEFCRQPSSSVCEALAYRRDSPVPVLVCAMMRRNPKVPTIVRTSNRLPAAGVVLIAMMPPAALPQIAEALDRTTSMPVTVARSMMSRLVRPSGSVSGIPSTITRMPRMVPALLRSPAPRAPNPRIVMRVSTPPERDVASTPGMPCSASARPMPAVVRNRSRPTCDTASGA